MVSTDDCSRAHGAVGGGNTLRGSQHPIAYYAHTHEQGQVFKRSPFARTIWLKRCRLVARRRRKAYRRSTLKT